MSDEQNQELTVTAPGHYRQEYIRCGKTRCKKCNPPEGTPATGHGPYWYRYIWAGGKQRKRYVGKHLPKEVQTRLELVPATPDDTEPTASATPKTPAAAKTPATTEPALTAVKEATAPTTPKTRERETVTERGTPDQPATTPSIPKTPTRWRGARIDVNSVRLERDDLGRWRVVAGSKRNPVVVGFLRPVTGLNGRTKGWKALTDTLMPIAPKQRPWKTRQEALVRLVDNYLHATERS